MTVLPSKRATSTASVRSFGVARARADCSRLVQELPGHRCRLSIYLEEYARGQIGQEDSTDGDHQDAQGLRGLIVTVVLALLLGLLLVSSEEVPSVESNTGKAGITIYSGRGGSLLTPSTAF